MRDKNQITIASAKPNSTDNAYGLSIFQKLVFAGFDQVNELSDSDFVFLSYCASIYFI